MRPVLPFPVRAGFCMALCAACSSSSSGGSSPSLGSTLLHDASAYDAGSSPDHDSGMTPAADAAADSPSTPGAEAGNGSDAQPSGPDGAPPICSSIAADGPVVGPMFVAGSRPAATGGTIADGTYWLTESDVYEANWEGPLDAAALTGIPVARTLVISGMTLQKAEATSADAGPGGTMTSTLFISTSGSNLSETPSCPFAAGAATAIAFCVVGSDLWLFPDLASREVYTHQP